jgi:hypothetical protein
VNTIVIQTNDKWKIKFDVDEKQYIFYRIMNKSEMAAHLVEAHKQEQSIQLTINTFQSYINDERVIEPKKEV